MVELDHLVLVEQQGRQVQQVEQEHQVLVEQQEQQVQQGRQVQQVEQEHQVLVVQQGRQVQQERQVELELLVQLDLINIIYHVIIVKRLYILLNLVSFLDHLKRVI